jgi:hypothetical protein
MAERKNVKKATQDSTVPAHRKKFKEYILANPNYFGTLPKFGGKVGKALSGDTTYEQLECLGLNPASSRLEGVINIKQHSGYGTDGCGVGTVEYVRYFVQDGSGWHDLGLDTVQVYNLPGPLPLSYSTSVNFSAAQKFCGTENILNVRAILSWEWEPTPGDPNFIPVWGNVVNARVQVAPWLIYQVPLGELLAQKVISIDPGILKDVILTQPLPAGPAKPLGYGEIKKLYANKKVPSHRFGFSAATKLVEGTIAKALAGAAITAKPSGAAKASPKAGLSSILTAGEELGAIVAALQDTSGDTTFEQLTCAGYNPQTRVLDGVIQVKLSSGYSGGLCTAGSTEYVGFYAFFGGTWHSLGTAQVQVHDLAAASPAKPVSYAVFRVANLTSVKCENLEGVPLRAILSWETPPTGPNYVPYWGNVVNTHAQPQIAPSDIEQMRLMRIGRVTVANIDNVTGLAVVDPVFVPSSPPGLGYVAGDCPGPGSPWLGPPVQPDSPFGGETIVEGDFLPKVDVFDHTTGLVLSGAKPIIYQAWVTPSGGSPFQLTNSFGIELYPPSAMLPVFMLQKVKPAPGPVPGGIAGTEYYQYMESDLQAVNPRTIAVFEAGGLTEGEYTIEIRGFKWDGANYVPVPVQSKMIHVYNGYPHFELTADGTIVQVFRPEVSITITSPSGDCGDVVVGDTIAGSYSVTEEFFGVVSIALVPITVGGVPQPENPVVNMGPGTLIYDGTNTGGTSGTFTLSTAGMTPCGYTILLGAWDRALVSSSCSGHYNEMGVGFCLRAKGKK